MLLTILAQLALAQSPARALLGNGALPQDLGPNSGSAVFANKAVFATAVVQSSPARLVGTFPQTFENQQSVVYALQRQAPALVPAILTAQQTFENQQGSIFSGLRLQSPVFVALSSLPQAFENQQSLIFTGRRAQQPLIVALGTVPQPFENQAASVFGGLRSQSPLFAALATTPQPFDNAGSWVAQTNIALAVAAPSLRGALIGRQQDSPESTLSYIWGAPPSSAAAQGPVVHAIGSTPQSFENQPSTVFSGLRAQRPLFAAVGTSPQPFENQQSLVFSGLRIQTPLFGAIGSLPQWPEQNFSVLYTTNIALALAAPPLRSALIGRGQDSPEPTRSSVWGQAPGSVSAQSPPLSAKPYVVPQPLDLYQINASMVFANLLSTIPVGQPFRAWIGIGRSSSTAGESGNIG